MPRLPALIQDQRLGFFPHITSHKSYHQKHTLAHLRYSSSYAMDYSTQDNQNAAPGTLDAAKLNGARKPDSQSVTKR